MRSQGCGNTFGRLVLGLAGVGVLGAGDAQAQGVRDFLKERAAASKPAAAPAKPPAVSDKDFAIETKVLPVNPSDPIAKVNGEVITRQQLADEVVARKGEEILETMISRKLIEQEIKAKNLSITAAEIDQEIDRVAKSMAGVGREAWLRTLHKERGISPVQYARDIIYPTLALRKLAMPGIVVTPQDFQENFATSFGEKLRCRIIMVNKLQAGKEIWEELKKNPDRFEKIAKDDPRSIDQGTRSLGGLLAEPVRRFAEPKDVSKRVFQDLVDGDSKDSDHKPKDGDISGVIQVTSDSWVIFKRESLEPGEKHDPNDPSLRKYLTEAIRENKIKEEMGKVYENITKNARIENRLTGTEKEANEDQHAFSTVDGQVKLSSDPGAAMPAKPGTLPATSSVAHPPAPNVTRAAKP